MLSAGLLLALAACRDPDPIPVGPTDTGGPDPHPLDLDGSLRDQAFWWPGPEVEVLGTTAHTLDLSLDAWDGRDVTVTCAGAGDRHTRETTARAGETLRFRGLLAEQTYRCGVVQSGGASTFVQATTIADEHPMPSATVTGDGAEIDDHYVIFNVLVDGIDANEQQVVIVDPEGRVRWSTWIGDDATGDLDSTYLGDGQVLYGGGYGVNPTIVDLDENVVWQAPTAPTGYNYHHHARRFSDGTIVSMTSEFHELDGTSYRGHWIGAFTEDGEVAWEWDTSEGVAQGHYDPDLDSSDTFHMNSVIEVDFPGCDMLTSLRNNDALSCFDHTTGTIAWTFDRDFTLVDEEGNPTDDWFPDGQHDPEVLGNRLMVFDNGRDRTGTVRTRVVEYELDTEARTARLLWDYHEPDWDEGIWGGVHRYGDDRVLIAFPHCMDCGPDDTDDIHSAIIALDDTHEPVWRMRFDEETVGIYRAELVDPCTIFENERYCVE